LIIVLLIWAAVRSIGAVFTDSSSVVVVHHSHESRPLKNEIVEACGGATAHTDDGLVMAGAGKNELGALI
jgi:hypothetical protein